MSGCEEKIQNHFSNEEELTDFVTAVSNSEVSREDAIREILNNLKRSNQKERERITNLTKRTKRSKVGNCIVCKTQEYFVVPGTWAVVYPLYEIYGKKSLNDYVCFRCFFDFEDFRKGEKNE